MGRPQPTIARWENGGQEPSFAAVQQALRACGVELGLGLFPYDASDVRMAAVQLKRPPGSRLPAGRLAAALRTVAGCGLRVLVAGETGAALVGSPLSIHEEQLLVVCHPQDLDAAAGALGDAVRLVLELPGSSGWRDLNAGAEDVVVEEGVTVRVVGVLDLLRVALSDREDPAAGRKALALDGALRARRAASPVVDEVGPAERVERWLQAQI